MNTHTEVPSRPGRPTPADPSSKSEERTQRRLRMSLGMTPSNLPSALPSVSDLLTPEDVAQRLNITTKTLANYRARSTGPAYVRVAGRIYYSQDAYLRYWHEQIGRAS